MRTLTSRSWVILAVGLGALGILTWKFGVKPVLATRDAYEGTIAEKYKKSHGGQYTRYTHHWTVECTDGETRSVEVKRTLWMLSSVGSPVRKIRGERWPRLPEVDRSPGRKYLEKLLEEYP